MKQSKIFGGLIFLYYLCSVKRKHNMSRRRITKIFLMNHGFKNDLDKNIWENAQHQANHIHTIDISIIGEKGN